VPDQCQAEAVPNLCGTVPNRAEQCPNRRRTNVRRETLTVLAGTRPMSR
jgi:hypothetical protein